MSQENITLCTRLTRADVAGLIEALVESLKEGTLKIQKSDDSRTLEVPRVVDLEVEGGEVGDRTVFRLEVSWRTNPPEIPDEADMACHNPKIAASAVKPAKKIIPAKGKAVEKKNASAKAAGNKSKKPA